MIHPVILAGGAGTRLWPLSTAARPKHLLNVLPGGTLLEQTVARVSDGGRFDRPTVVCSARQAEDVRKLAPRARLILEPMGRNSAPAIALAALSAPADALLLVLPSDHHIADVAAFMNAVDRGAAIAEIGMVVTFGIVPDRPETGYGYIASGSEIGEGAFAVDRFVEKPDTASAKQMLAGGRHFWNAGIFLLEAGALVEELEIHAPDIAAAAREALQRAAMDGDAIAIDAQSFAKAPAISIDYAVMERSERVAVVPVDMGWSDLGTWAALQDIAERDEQGNAIDAGSVAIASSGCMVKSTGPRVAVVGLDDVIVVATPDGVLVTSRDQAQLVRNAAERIGQASTPSF